MSKIELPPLPEPFAGYGTNDVFSEAQLRARDRQIVELCASLAEAMRPAGGRAWSAEQHACFAALTDCAAAIRSLLDEKKGNE